MFDIAAKRLAWITVSWPGLVQRDPQALAEPVTHTIEVQVELLDQNQIDALNDRYAEPVEGSDLAAREKRRGLEADAMMDIVHDWRGVSDGTKSVAFNRDAALRMVKVPGFSAGFNESYVKALGGIVEEREKNSAASPPAGQEAAAASDAK